VLTAADHIEIRYTSERDIDTAITEQFQKVLASSGAAKSMHAGVKRVHELPIDPRMGKFRITEIHCPDTRPPRRRERMGALCRPGTCGFCVRLCQRNMFDS
jgi:hypothetical protein